MDAKEIDHQKALRKRIEDLFERGVSEFQGILRALGGADPREVYEIWHKIAGSPARSKPRVQWITPGIGGNWLPIEDPARGQWWFTPNTTEWIVNYIEGISPPTSRSNGTEFDVIALGTPTVALALARTRRVCCLDIDKNVIDAVSRRAPNTITHVYDVASELPSTVRSRGAVVMLDPPWYRPTMDAFVARALQACRPPGHLIMTLPSRYTRPGAEEEKQALIKKLTAAGLQVRLYQREQLEFTVPVFERRAFQDITEFRGIPWRRADVLHLAVENTEWADRIESPECEPELVTTYSRDPRYFRVFVSKHNGGNSTGLPSTIVFSPLESYRRDISRRRIGSSDSNVWTSDHRAGRADVRALEVVLDEWTKPDTDTAVSRTNAIRALEDYGAAPDVAKGFVRSLDDELELWGRFHHRSMHRTDTEIVKNKASVASPLASTQEKGTPDNKGPGYREHDDPSDTFRAEYQRDRDRVLWSKSLRHLANKTQLFPVERSDQLRQRLAHSLEVMQLATTIADAFGLNRDLVEAGALAHDIGHTPFGHAGEHALDELLYNLNTKLGGFNHYEHGVDVVRYLEDPYQSRLGSDHVGLNLTSSVCECILKHAFCHVDEKWKYDRETIWRMTKHAKFILPGNPHLEAQAVRLADKISYLVSDLEDGIILGAVRREDLLSCRLFHYAPVDFRATHENDIHCEFLIERRNIIQIIMEDAIVSSESRIARLSNAVEARNVDHFVIDHSDEMRIAIDEVWNQIQKRRLHQDARVIMANLRAAKIIKELTVLFAIFPNLIDLRFEAAYQRIRNSEYMKWYRDKVGQKTRIVDGYIDFLPLHWLIDMDPVRTKEFAT